MLVSIKMITNFHIAPAEVTQIPISGLISYNVQILLIDLGSRDVVAGAGRLL